MKKRILSVIIIFTFAAAVASCAKSPDIPIEESAAPTATPEISVTAEPLPTNDALVEEEDTGVEILFPYPESEAYGLTGIDALLFDTAAMSFSTRGAINRVWIPHFAILDVRERLGTTYYTCWLRERTFFDARTFADREYHYDNEYDFPKLDGTEDTASMWSENDSRYWLSGPVIFMLREDENGEQRCTIFDGLEWGHPFCEFLTLLNPAFDDIITESELYALYDESCEFPISGARWVTPEDPTELLDKYLNYYFYSGSYDEEWVKEHNEELDNRRWEVLVLY